MTATKNVWDGLVKQLEGPKPITQHNTIKLATELIKKHGLVGWSFKLNTNKRRLGVCKYNSRKYGSMFGTHLYNFSSADSGGVIEISIHHLKDGVEKVTNTILHEIAHALVGPGHSHDHVWYSKAKAIGCDGKRCGEGMEVEPNYIGTCPGGHKHTAFRLRRGRKSCTACNPYGGFNEKYLIVWKSNKA